MYKMRKLKETERHYGQRTKATKQKTLLGQYISCTFRQSNYFYTFLAFKEF